jgi:hypothetical protein
MAAGKAEATALTELTGTWGSPGRRQKRKFTQDADE